MLPALERPSVPKQNKADLQRQIQQAKLELDAAKRIGDELKIDLAEAALNNLLDRYSCNT